MVFGHMGDHHPRREMSDRATPQDNKEGDARCESRVERDEFQALGQIGCRIVFCGVMSYIDEAGDV